jgi:hypothetical protein
LLGEKVETGNGSRIARHKWVLGIVLVTMASLATVAFVLVSRPVILIFSTNTQEPEWARETKLQVDAAYLLTAEDENAEDNIIPIVANLYITNAQWNESGDVEIVAYLLRRNPDIGIDKGTLEVGKVRGGTTKEAGVQLVLPDLNTAYDIDFLVFENDLLVLRGEGNIQIVRSVLLDGSVKNYVQLNTEFAFNQVN